ncbi:MAG: putative glycosyltransferase [Edafosvirus sp.]|uniref:Putative glycosyltransferase n=1 Tax=Edafosvirus sp. TaxID=2487765 RepID=A0A3G4ZY22_9VIRU|nr:MAG: putative glycosyltransferase [Edafosvirus sp.]
MESNKFKILNTVNFDKYSLGIILSKTFLAQAKTKGIKILCGHLMYFMHNVDLWCQWFIRLGIQPITVTDDISTINEDDLCVVIAQVFDKCPAKHYIAIQTENFTTIGQYPESYNTTVDKNKCLNVLQNAYVVWDYSISNIEYLMTNHQINKIVPIGVMFSDNTSLFKTIYLSNNFENRNIDIIVSTNTPRRVEFTKLLQEKQLKCGSVWRTALPSVIHTCKIFLNIHAYGEISALEIHRLFDLRNCQIVIVSEQSADVDYQNTFNKIPFLKLEDIPDFCHKLCNDKELWNKYLEDQLNMWKRITNDVIHQELESVLYI